MFFSDFNIEETLHYQLALLGVILGEEGFVPVDAVVALLVAVIGVELLPQVVQLQLSPAGELVFAVVLHFG